MAILYERKGHIAHITINTPEKANVLNRQNMDELAQAWKNAWEDHEVRAIILTGAGDRHFCAGHDLSGEGRTREEARKAMFDRFFWPASGALGSTPVGVDPYSTGDYPQILKPVIGAINGWTVGAGFYLMLTSTDIRLACAEHARFRYGLLNNGWMGGGPGATRLSRQVAYADAMRILMTDDPFDAKEAKEMRLISEVVPHDRLMARAEEIGEHIAKMAPVALRMMKEFLVRYRDIPTSQAWHVSEMMNFLTMTLTTDPEEGRQAFLEKRPAKFTGGLRYPT